MANQDSRRIRLTKAAAKDRLLIEIPLQDIGCHYSSLTDYLDKVVGYGVQALTAVDRLVNRFHLGAVSTRIGGHYGTVLPRISRSHQVVGGSVLYFDADSGAILQQEPLVEHLYSWYCFDYYTDNEVFFGEHLLSNRPVAVVTEEKTALLGTLAEPSIDWLAVGQGGNLSHGMMTKLDGMRVVLFPDDMNSEHWSEQFGGKFKVDCGFVHQDINQYLIEKITGRSGP